MSSRGFSVSDPQYARPSEKCGSLRWSSQEVALVIMSFPLFVIVLAFAVFFIYLLLMIRMIIFGRYLPFATVRTGYVVAPTQR
uniref:Movement protein n=1 Tax=Steinernema glaseri TaxID=37863 RepID=A0A1I8AMJ1_9BILA